MLRKRPIQQGLAAPHIAGEMLGRTDTPARLAPSVQQINKVVDWLALAKVVVLSMEDAAGATCRCLENGFTLLVLPTLRYSPRPAEGRPAVRGIKEERK